MLLDERSIPDCDRRKPVTRASPSGGEAPTFTIATGDEERSGELRDASDREGLRSVLPRVSLRGPW